MLNGGGVAPLGPLDLGDNELCGIGISPESHTGKGKARVLVPARGGASCLLGRRFTQC